MFLGEPKVAFRDSAREGRFLEPFFLLMRVGADVIRFQLLLLPLLLLKGGLPIERVSDSVLLGLRMGKSRWEPFLKYFPSFCAVCIRVSLSLKSAESFESDFEID